MKPKVILITGTSSGIGYETAIFLALHGHKVYASMRNLEKKTKLVEESNSKKLAIEVCELDVTDSTSIQNCIDIIMEKEKRIDVLINNAGFAFVGGFVNSKNSDFDHQFATNFFGALNCTRAVFPIMKEQKQGLILNVSSILGLVGVKEASIYCSSKFALEGWSESIRYEFKKFGIYVSLIEPGFFKTEIFNNVKSVDSKEYNSNISAMPIDVARKIAKIIEIKSPKIRYRIGTDCFLGDISKKILPSRFFEKIMDKYYK